MTDPESLTEIEKLLLMAATVHGLGPKTDLSGANTAEVVRQALRWAGLWDKVDRAWIRGGEEYSVIDPVYGPLVRMVQASFPVDPGKPAENAGEVLFEGAGNWGDPQDSNDPPADPTFNSCRLTVCGMQLARQLLEQHPEYRKTPKQENTENVDRD